MSSVLTPQLAEMYHRVKRRPKDGSLASAIRVHAQACGLVAYVFDIHPDGVAEAVRDAKRDLRDASSGRSGSERDCGL